MSANVGWAWWHHSKLYVNQFNEPIALLALLAVLLAVTHRHKEGLASQAGEFRDLFHDHRAPERSGRRLIVLTQRKLHRSCC